ncbi:MAG TPA: Holliday junction resolvase RuvX [Steroidobacteraceae bacterium]|nr:Holliday junction resolvase RuvX [Steroidobacteraceae bacterium]
MPDPAQRPAGPRIALAFDFGRRRIGVAAGDTLTGTAAPRPAVAALAGVPDWPALEREIRALCPHVLVVGVPYNDDGSDGSLAAATREFGRALAARFGLPVEHVDEHGSSLEAGLALRQQRASGQRRRRVQRADIDSAAAAVILTRWLAGEGDRRT